MERDFIKNCISSFESGIYQNDHIYKADDWKRFWSEDQSYQFPEYYFIRDIILWDPITLVIDDASKLYCPSCSLDSDLKPSRWADGLHSSSYKPRELYGLCQDTLLISRIYRCSSANHRILAHDPGVLTQTCSQIQEPFILFHKVI